MALLSAYLTSVVAPMVLEEGISKGNSKMMELVTRRKLNKRIESLLPKMKCSLESKAERKFLKLVRDALLTDMDRVSICTRLKEDEIASGQKRKCYLDYIVQVKDKLRSDENIGKYFTDDQFKSYMLNSTRQLEIGRAHV